MVNRAFFMIVAVFDPSPLTVRINCSSFTYTFAVLLPDLCRLSCHSVQRMFSKMNKRQPTHKSVKKCNYWGPIFETEWSRGSNCVRVPNFVAIGSTVAEIWRFFDFSRWRPTPSWICYVCVRTTHEGHLVVFITVQNLDAIDAIR